ncbi:MAG TPA: phosphatase domain-containing protein [Burkholderiales bacterium]|nr:phosphatase domain-containing protein [Burkholderiales bacterium]
MADGAKPKHAHKGLKAQDQIVILPYRGYGNSAKIVLPGRVLEDEGFRPTLAGERRWRNFAAFLKRIESDEVPYAALRARFGAQQVELRADNEGYFRLELGVRALKAGWQEVELALADDPAVKARGRVLVPSAKASFAVISDIDDTVVYSHVMSKVRMLLTVALSNARTRKPFEGVAAFYRALHAGCNPFFYVSKSPWNLYVPIAEYLETQGLPEGPLFLRNLGLRMPHDHKQGAIGALLEAYPRLPFILIGDSGEADPEIYSEIVRRYPQRIRVIYIRSVDRHPKRVAAIERLIVEVAKTRCQLVLAPDSEHAAAHAAAEGLIAASELRAVRVEKKKDENA